MNKTSHLIIGLAVIALSLSSVCFAAEKTAATSEQASYQAVMKIEGMTCMGCVNKVKSTLSALDGVQSCDVNLEESRATVVYDNKKLNDAILVDTVKKAGFTAQIGDLKMVGEHHSPAGCAMGDAKSADAKGCSAASGGKKTCTEAEKAKCAKPGDDKK